MIRFAMYLRIFAMDVLDTLSNYVNDPRTLALFTLIGGGIVALFQKYVFGDFDMIGIVLLFIIIDSWSGWRKAAYLHKIDPILNEPATGSRLRYGLAKKCVEWFIMLTALHLFSRVVIKVAMVDLFGFDINFFAVVRNGTMLYLIWLEMKSIDDNLKACGRRFLPLQIIDKFTAVFGIDEKLK